MTPITPAITPARSASPLTVSIASARSGRRAIVTSASPWYGTAATYVPPSAFPLANESPPSAAVDRIPLELRGRGRRGAEDPEPDLLLLREPLELRAGERSAELRVLEGELLPVAAEGVLRAVGELRDDDRSRRRGDHRERDPSHQRTPMKVESRPAIVGFPACPKAIPSIARPQRLQVLVGELVEVETPHPRAAVKGLAERLDGRGLDAVEAEGKNLLLCFEGGLVLRSHLRMNGRWRVERRGRRAARDPWLVLRGDEYEAVQWNGPILELVTAQAPGRGPTSSRTSRPRSRRFRAVDQRRAVGDALLDQRLVAGIGNMWKAEALWEARLSPWRRSATSRTTSSRGARGGAPADACSVAGTRPLRHVYRRAGRACHRCGAVIRSAPQGEHARTAYWCPGCQGRRAAPAAS